MSDEQGHPRKVQVRLNRKFGVGEDLDRPYHPKESGDASAPVKPVRKVPYGGWGTKTPEERAAAEAALPPETPPVAPSEQQHQPRKPRGEEPWRRKSRDRFEPHPSKKTPYDSLLLSQKAALSNPETAEAMQAQLDPPWFKHILSLSTDKGRDKEGKFLVEGVRCVQEMLQYHSEVIDGIYVEEGFADRSILDSIEEKSIRLHPVESEQMRRMSTTVTSQGVVAVCRSASTKPDYDLCRTLTLVDGVQDPGNLGAIFRTSLGFNMGVLLGKGTVNPFNPKVVRGSSGTFLRVPFEQDVDMLERIQFLRHKGFTIVATDLHAKQSLDQIAPRKLRKVAILVGNEGAGAAETHIQHADEVVRIPMSQTLESLNVSVAHGILCFQIAQLRENY
ncbi:MAG TPA: RNA methyltransferase [Fibrobacteraceae bacterium]|nr:RNA methyltransferase [Fibrobacteraceae bacterium]